MVLSIKLKLIVCDFLNEHFSEWIGIFDMICDFSMWGMMKEYATKSRKMEQFKKIA